MNFSGSSMGTLRIPCTAGFFILVFVTFANNCFAQAVNCSQGKSKLSIYDFKLPDLYGNVISLKQFKKQVVLITNVASFSDDTATKYKDLNTLQKKYGTRGFIVIGIPCNQFAYQEPGSSAAEILNTLRYVRPGHGFKPSFILMKKQNVNGETQHPLYTYLKSVCPPTAEELKSPSQLMYRPLRTHDVRWNFEGFLVDKKGHPVHRYSHEMDIKTIESFIEHLLKQKPKVTDEHTETDDVISMEV